MKLTKYEQETIINYNQEEDMAQIYTCDKNLIRKIDAHIEKTRVNYCIRRDEESATYSLPTRRTKWKLRDSILATRVLTQCLT